MSALHPGARLLHYVLADLAGDDREVTVPSSALLERTGWANRASLRKRTRDLVDAGLIEVIETVRADGGRGPNCYVLTGG